MPTPSPNGSLYFLTFRDDYSGYGFIRFLKRKSEANEHIQDLIARFETETGRSIVIFRSDNGGEFMSKDLIQWLAKRGIIHQTSTPKTPEQNGVAERYNRTILESMKSMLHSSTLPVKLWAEASATAVYLLNRVPCKAVPTMTPYQAWHGRKPNVSHLHVFGCDAYAHIPKDERTKLDPKGVKCNFVGYSETQKAFRLWDSSSGKIKISRDVIFNESIQAPSLLPVAVPRTDLETVSVIGVGGDACEASNGRATVSNDQRGQPASDSDIIAEPFHGFEQPEKPILGDHHLEPSVDSPQRPSRIRKKPNRLIEDPNFLSHTDMNVAPDEIFEPQTYQEAISCPESAKWISAMEEEMESLRSNETWQLQPLPEGRRQIRNKWVYTVKYDSANRPTRFKARLVAKGFSQKEGIDFNETFAPVVRHELVRVILSAAAAHDLEIIQLDVKTAFLHGDLHEEIFMDQPSGFISSDSPNHACRLLKSLYGLKQASRSWNIKFDGYLCALGFVRSLADPCVYRRSEEDGIVILAIWVDDGLLCGPDKTKLLELISQLSTHLDITARDADFFIGLKIDRDRTRRVIHLSQEQSRAERDVGVQPENAACGSICEINYQWN
jgi:hypothetical protein